MLVYSDVHGNLPAFEAVLKQAGSVDGYICLGDLVNYGPWSNECVDLAQSLPNSVFIRGNHEHAFLTGSYPGSNPLVRLFFDRSFPGFTRHHVIATYIDQWVSNGWVFTHTVKDLYIYPDTRLTLDANYVIGHSHHQFSYENSGFSLFNAGSVGQNRRWINRADYLVWEKDKNRFSMASALYNLDLLISKMRGENYPQDCIDYYLSKERA